MSRRADGIPGELDARIVAWLDDGPDVAPRSLVEGTLAPIPMMHQRHRSIAAWGRIQVSVATLVRLGLVGAVVVAVVAVGSWGVGRDLAGLRSGGGARSTTADELPTNDGPLARGLGWQPGASGSYRSLRFVPTVRFAVPDGWSVTGRAFRGGVASAGNETPTSLPLFDGSGYILIARPAALVATGSSFDGAPWRTAPVPADLFEWLRTDPELALGPTSQASIGGYPARVVEGSLAPSAKVDPGDGYLHLSDELVLLPRDRFRIAVVNVGPQQVLVAVIADTGSLESFASVADPVVASLRFSPPGPTSPPAASP